MPVKRQTYINEVAEFCGLDCQTIEELLDSGLLNTAAQDEDFLNEKDFDLLHRVSRLKNTLGVNLAGIEVIVHMREQILHLQDELRRLQQVASYNKTNLFHDLE